MHKDMKELYSKVVKDIWDLDEFIFKNEDSEDFMVRNTVNIKRGQLKAMIDLRDALDKALWERYDDNNM